MDASDPGLVGAIDIGASKTLIGVRRLPVQDWRRDRARTVRLPTGADPRTFTTVVATALRKLADAQGGSLLAVGCAAPGPLDRGRGVIIHSPNQGWRDVPIVSWLIDDLGVPVLLDDDANLGALGEWTLGAGRDADPMVFVTLGSGIGAGIVIGGQIHRGAHGLAGEVGHAVVDPLGPTCGCGRRGCVEAYAGGASLARRARKMWPGGRTRDSMAAPLDAATIFRAARAGDPEARQLTEGAVEAIARGLASIAAVLDPAAIVVGGSLADGQRASIRRAVARARLRCLAETGRALVVRHAALGDESVLAGAAVSAARIAEGG